MALIEHERTAQMVVSINKATRGRKFLKTPKCQFVQIGESLNAVLQFDQSRLWTGSHAAGFGPNNPARTRTNRIEKRC